MSFRALLVTKDDQVAETLTPVLSNFGLRTECCGYSDAVCLITEQKFQAVLVDYDDPPSASLILQNLTSTPFQANAVTVALLSDKNKVRNVFGAGANFVLYKPLDETQATTTLRAATVLLKRERRTAFRVPIQVAVQLILANGTEGAAEMEGILLDLSETGMDVLAAQPLYPSARVKMSFLLPNAASEFELLGEVAWANPNGETGVRFRDTPESVHGALHGWLAQNSRPGTPVVPEAVADCLLTDLSLGACYVETASPFPERTQVVMIVAADELEFRAQGLVRVMHPSRGMGVEFAMRNGAERQQTEEFIRFLMSRPGVRPQLRVAPQVPENESDDETSSLGQFDSEIEDPLLDLLRNHESFSEEMFLQALKSQRSAEVIES
ncbi:MAG TPA: PilZ domain-containing protein [Terriglobales bacterium]|jgi:DNA-binding response OmpR family regulator|nr:PilZ domain-containing protein [Terriglobales bacterium]